MRCQLCWTRSLRTRPDMAAHPTPPPPPTAAATVLYCTISTDALATAIGRVLFPRGRGVWLCWWVLPRAMAQQPAAWMGQQQVPDPRFDINSLQ